jgi:hypothetical protein
MFFDARDRFEQKRPNEYVRGLLSQYGDHGKPMQLNRPSHSDARQAKAFRQRELEEMRYAKQRTEELEAQLAQSRNDSLILARFAKQFLAKPTNARGRGHDRELNDGHTGGAPVLLPKNHPPDADDALGTQEINSSPIPEDDGAGVAGRSGRGAPVVLKKEPSAQRGNVQPRSVRAADDGEREPEGAADHTGQASEHDAA